MAGIKLIEFNNVINVLGISATSQCKTEDWGYFGTVAYTLMTHKWNDLEIRYNMTAQSCVTISGRIPLELAENICQNNYNRGLTWWSYATETAGYEILNESHKTEPRNVATSDAFKNWIEEKKSEKKRDVNVYVYIPNEIISSTRKDFVRQNPSKAYIESFTFHNIEGLVVFFTELQAYYAKKTSEDKEETTESINKKCTQLLGDIIQASLNIVRPEIGIREWLKEHRLTTLEASINHQSSDIQEKTIRELITTYDQTATPYSDVSLEVLPPQKFCDKLDISCYYGKQFPVDPVMSMMIIKDKKSDRNSTVYKRTENSIEISLNYNISRKAYVHVSHLCSRKDSSESITISVEGKKTSSLGRNLPSIVDINYNLTTKTGIFRMGGRIEPMTPENKAKFIKLLQFVIANGEKITTNNMTTGGRQKVNETVVS